MAQYTVQIKATSPLDTYRRNGISLSKANPVTVDEAEVTEAMRADPFLTVTKVGPEPRATGEKQDKPA